MLVLFEHVLSILLVACCIPVHTCMGWIERGIRVCLVVESVNSVDWASGEL